jgi:hypothetical protein
MRFARRINRPEREADTALFEPESRVRDKLFFANHFKPIGRSTSRRLKISIYENQK